MEGRDRRREERRDRRDKRWAEGRGNNMYTFTHTGTTTNAVHGAQ
jgi:hypothetical protein